MDKKIYFIVNGYNLWRGGVYYIAQLKNNLKRYNIDLIVTINDFDLKAIKIFNDNDVCYKKIRSKKFFFPFYRLLLSLGFSFVRIGENSNENKITSVIFHGLIPFGLSSSKFKKIYWLPDILHRIFPNNFTTFNLVTRNIFTKISINKADSLLLSSNSVKKDFFNYYKLNKQIIVHRFPSKCPFVINSKSEFKMPFVLFPHEFWIHKRQEKIIELANNNKNFHFVLTGNNRIGEKNSSFSSFKKALLNLKFNNLTNLGIVDWDVLVNLFNTAEYIGNLSDYEGWNTSVEMAKSLNKKLILSEIATHIEQTENYGNVIWFKDGLVLPNKFKTVVFDYTNESELNYKKFCENIVH